MQVDEPRYTGYVDQETLARIAARGEDPMKNLARAVDASNAVRDLVCYLRYEPVGK